MADQGVSSLGNFVLGLVVARSLGAHDFGAFSLAYVTYNLALNISRGLATDPMVVRFSGTRGKEWRTAVRAASSVAVTVGLVIGAVCAAVGLLLGGVTRTGFLALAITLPALLLQDSWRFAFFARHKPWFALLNDALWTGTMLLSLVALRLTGALGVASAILAFGGTAAVAAAFGLLQTRAVPDMRQPRRWLAAHRDLAGRYVIENAGVGFATQGRLFVLGALVGLSGVGVYRAAEMLMGPFLIILMGVSQVAVPEASRALRQSPARLLRFCHVMAWTQTGVSTLWGLGLAVALPLGGGELVLGSLWHSAEPLLLPMVATTVAASWCTAAAAGLRATGRSKQSLRGQTFTAVATLVGCSIGALIAGPLGAAWGSTVATWLGAWVWWRLLHRVLSGEEHALTREFVLPPESVDVTAALEPAS